MSKSDKLLMPPRLLLDGENLDTWSLRIKGYLIGIQNWVLRVLERQIKSDGSSSPEVLASIRIAKKIVPCPVEWHCLNKFYLLRFRLGKGTYDYINNPPSCEFHETLIESNIQWNETFDPRSQEVWMKIPEGKPFENFFAVSMLKQALESLIRDEHDHLIQLRDRELGVLGYRPIELRIPGGDPDIRIESVTRLTDGQITRLSAADLVSDMQKGSKLLAICPGDIEQVMQRARLLYVRAYHEWDFFTISVHYAVLALEASLRAMYDEWLGTEDVKVSAKIEEEQIVKKISPPRENILKWANEKQARKVICKGAPLPRNKSNILDHAVRIGVISLWEREKCAYLLQLRDVFSHPKGTFIEWISWASGNIFESCLWINLMWARFYKSMPYEFAWKEKPKHQIDKNPTDQGH